MRSIQPLLMSPHTAWAAVPTNQRLVLFMVISIVICTVWNSFWQHYRTARAVVAQNVAQALPAPDVAEAPPPSPAQLEHNVQPDGYLAYVKEALGDNLVGLARTEDDRQVLVFSTGTLLVWEPNDRWAMYPHVDQAGESKIVYTRESFQGKTRLKVPGVTVLVSSKGEEVAVPTSCVSAWRSQMGKDWKERYSGPPAAPVAP